MGIIYWAVLQEALSSVLRVGRVSVAIRGLVYFSWAGTSYIARDRYSADRISLCL